MILMFRTALLAAAVCVASLAQAGPREDFAPDTQGLKGLYGRFEQRVFDYNGRLK